MRSRAWRNARFARNGFQDHASKNTKKETLMGTLSHLRMELMEAQISFIPLRNNLQ